MTAEERAEKYLKDNSGKYAIFRNTNLMKLHELDMYSIMTDYLNSQRDTIFKEELEKKLPSEKEIDNNAPCNPDASKEDVMAHNWFIGGAEWLIQYLKK